MFFACAALAAPGCGDDAGGTQTPDGSPPSSDAAPADAAPADAASGDAAPGADASDIDAGPPPDYRIVDLVGFPGAVHGMVVDDTGRVFLSDTFGGINSTRAVYYLDPPYTGQVQETGITSTQPAGLMWEDGALFVCDVSDGTVTVYDDKTFAQRDQWQAEQPWNVARASDNALLVITNTNKLQRLVDGAPAQTLISDLQAPFDLAPMADGTVWISEQGVGTGTEGQLTRRTLDGSVVDQPDYQWDNPEGLALAPDGTLWVAETEREEIIRIVPGGEPELVGKVTDLPIVITLEDKDSLLLNLTGPGGGRLCRAEPVPGQTRFE